MPANSTTLDPEWSILLAACSELPRTEKTERIRLLLPQLTPPVRWKILLDLADRHGAQPLLYQALVALEGAVPREQIPVIEQRYQINLHKSLLLSRELIRVVDHLSALGLAVMPYKGLALAELLYGDIALRQTGDIDLLVRPQDFPRTRAAVRELGYAPHLSLSAAEERAYLKSGCDIASGSL